MKVDELIAELKKFPKTMEVAINSGEIISIPTEVYETVTDTYYQDGKKKRVIIYDGATAM